MSDGIRGFVRGNRKGRRGAGRNTRKEKLSNLFLQLSIHGDAPPPQMVMFHLYKTLDCSLILCFFLSLQLAQPKSLLPAASDIQRGRGDEWEPASGEKHTFLFCWKLLHYLTVKWHSNRAVCVCQAIRPNGNVRVSKGMRGLIWRWRLWRGPIHWKSGSQIMLRGQCHGDFHSGTMSHEICTACRCGSTLEHRPISISYRTNYHILYFELEISSFSQHFIHLLLIMLLRSVVIHAQIIIEMFVWALGPFASAANDWELFKYEITTFFSFYFFGKWRFCHLSPVQNERCVFFKYNLHWFQFPGGMYEVACSDRQKSNEKAWAKSSFKSIVWHIQM